MPRSDRLRFVIRRAAALALAVLVVYLVALAVNGSRENLRLTRELKAQQERNQREMVGSLADLLAMVKAGEQRAIAAGRTPTVTTEQAVEALKRVFPPALVEKAVAQAARPGPRGSTGPQGPPGPSGSTTTTPGSMPPGNTPTTSTTTTTSRPSTTTTTRPCLLELLGVAKVGC